MGMPCVSNFTMLQIATRMQFKARRANQSPIIPADPRVLYRPWTLYVDWHVLHSYMHDSYLSPIGPNDLYTDPSIPFYITL